MNDDEEALSIWDRAVDVSNIYGPQIMKEVDGYAAEATTTAAVLLSAFCITANISMHSAVDLLMSAYKGILVLNESEDEE